MLLPEMWLMSSVDDVIYSLPKSVLHRCNHENNWEGVDGRAILDGAVGSLRALLKAGNKVIFDAVVSNETNADGIGEAVSGFDALTIELKCELAVLKRRASGRGDRTMEETRRTFESSRAHVEPDLVLDSSKHTSEELASKVVDEIRKF